MGVIFFAIVCALNLAAIIWFIERNSNEDFQSTFGAGLWTSFWYCFVTMTTVGYGDKVPKNFVSRILCLIWMLFGLMLTAIITTTVMESVQDEYSKVGKRTAVTHFSSEEEIVRSQLSGIPVSFESYMEVIKAVQDRTVDIGILEANVASYIFQEKSEQLTDLKMESEVSIESWINTYVFHNDDKTNLSFVMEPFIPQVAWSKAIAKYVPPYLLTPYYNRNLSEVFNKQDAGVVLYLSISAGIMISLAIATELLLRISDALSKGKQTRKDTQKTIPSKYQQQRSKHYKKLLSIEKNFQEMIESLKEEMLQDEQDNNIL